MTSKHVLSTAAVTPAVFGGCAASDDWMQFWLPGPSYSMLSFDKEWPRDSYWTDLKAAYSRSLEFIEHDKDLPETSVVTRDTWYSRTPPGLDLRPPVTQLFGDAACTSCAQSGGASDDELAGECERTSSPASDDAQRLTSVSPSFDASQNNRIRITEMHRRAARDNTVILSLMHGCLRHGYLFWCERYVRSVAARIPDTAGLAETHRLCRKYIGSVPCDVNFVANIHAAIQSVVVAKTMIIIASLETSSDPAVLKPGLRVSGPIGMLGNIFVEKFAQMRSMFMAPLYLIDSETSKWYYWSPHSNSWVQYTAKPKFMGNVPRCIISCEHPGNLSNNTLRTLFQ